MKYLFLLIPLALSSCASIKWITLDHGQIVTDKGQRVDIIGNLPLFCHYDNSSYTFSGYFMFQKEDGTIVLDDFGRGIILLKYNPICRLGLDG